MQTDQAGSSHRLYEGLNSHKTSFASIYDAPTPTAYFTAMRDAEYQIPQNAKLTTLVILRAAKRAKSRRSIRVLDVGCSYGVNAALLKHDISLDDLYEHYSSQACAGLTRSQLIYRDRAFYSSRRKSPDLECIGFDAAGEAVRYAAACGLLDFPWHANFEAEHPQGYHGGDGLLRSSGIDAVLSTGCVGYITERTFDRLLTLLRPRSAPWIISYALRIFDYRPIEQTLVKYGYVTEQLHGQSFVQRRFLTRSEREHTVARVRGRCLETTDLEETGYFYSDRNLRPESVPSPRGQRFPWRNCIRPDTCRRTGPQARPWTAPHPDALGDQDGTSARGDPRSPESYTPQCPATVDARCSGIGRRR